VSTRRHHDRYVAAVGADAVVHTDGLSKVFGDVVAVDHLDLELVRGEVFGYLGPNGAGKTTTLRLLLGLLHPTAGTARVLDLDPWADTVELHRRIAYVPGEFAVWPSLTGAEMLDLLGNLHDGWDAAFRAELCERFEFDPSRKGRTYSRGNRQKIALIAALMVRPELLVMDEPTSGLDPLMEVQFREVLADGLEHGQTALLSSHILAEVDAACDRVGILRAGRLVEVGPLEELRIHQSRRVEIEFVASPPDLGGVDGVTDVKVDGHVVSCQLSGPPTELLRVVAPHEVRTFTTREADIEEVFLAYYGAR
jgi:polyether ionophore transport system ATP-binding protein